MVEGGDHPTLSYKAGCSIPKWNIPIEREGHRPQVELGMVAWAGPRGVQFFIALANHTEARLRPRAYSLGKGAGG